MSNNHSNALTLPPMLLIRQNFEVPARLEIKAALHAEWDRLVSNLDISPGTRVAVGVGKRTTMDCILAPLTDSLRRAFRED